MDKLSLLFLGFDDSSSPTEEQIKEAFRKISLLVHPDSGGNEKTFRGLTLAKETLLASVPKKKPTTTNFEDEFNYNYYKFKNDEWGDFNNSPKPSPPQRSQTEIDKDIRTWAELCCKWLHNHKFYYVSNFSIELQTYNKAELIVTTDGFGYKETHYRFFKSISLSDKELLLQCLIWLYKKKQFSQYSDNGYLPNGTEVKFSYVKNPWYKRLFSYLPINP